MFEIVSLKALMASKEEVRPALRVIPVVVVPLPAQGHLNQLLHLSHLLAARGIPVHYVGSASHNRQARERALGWQPESPGHRPIRFHDFILPPFPSPPASTHAPLAHLLPLFDAAALHFRSPLAALLRSLTTSSRRVVLIHDSTMAFAVSVAASVPHVEAFSFHSVSAFSLLLYYCESRGKPPDDPSIAKLNIPDIPNNACFTEQFLDFLRRQHESTAADSGRLFNTCRGIEGRFIDLLAREPQWRTQKTFAIGPLNPLSITKRTGCGPRHPCLEWLDKQPPASVLYVSFGTASALSDDQVVELAWGLEASRQRFIWVLRDADRADIYTEEGDEGKQKPKKSQEERLGRLDYDRRVERVGRVVRGWAPQLEILAHPSTGGFMSHCGWNSCMESMSMGVPLLAWPMHSDQPRNTLLLTRVLRVGITARDWARRNEVVPAAAIRDSIVRLMVSEEGKEVRARATAVGGVARQATTEGGTSRADFDAFITHITK
ncbi:zeatin O-glucosyltransferase-like [Phoenix dactylifera]|uniref:Glycosyltransferase n=1 Tax=Phoenix dactylifera TaxID=42345 RepID=A0A8B9A4T4_PHODC|nr:zeatin O-glucosyltransferase-like [Phoenix dactylifera]XP_038978858.1 zeatin O-glucosyltransferase-like [Phoenix dactylifera]